MFGYLSYIISCPIHWVLSVTQVWQGKMESAYMIYSVFFVQKKGGLIVFISWRKTPKQKQNEDSMTFHHCFLFYLPILYLLSHLKTFIVCNLPSSSFTMPLSLSLSQMVEHQIMWLYRARHQFWVLKQCYENWRRIEDRGGWLNGFGIWVWLFLEMGVL